ncbi:MAG TPA: hypothetical protein VGF85_10765 [Opitutaceae bacterium]|jgi:hypothetical protein
MKAQSETRRLPKTVFFVCDIVLVGAAWLIESQSERPLTTVPIIGIVVCVALATVLFVFPFVADYSRSQEEAFRERQNALQALATTVASSAEQVSIAASGLDRLATMAQENFVQSDRVAQQIHERMNELLSRLAEAKGDDAQAAARLEVAASRMGELHAQLSEVKPDDGAVAAKLEAAAKRIGRAVSELEAAAARAAEPPHPAASPAPVTHEVPPVLSSRIVEIKAAAAPSGAPFMANQPAEAPEEAAPPQSEPPAAAGSPSPPREEAPARKRAPRKPAPPAEGGGELSLEAPAAPPPEAAASAPDGATRLVVTAYIGIGNRLFIRGSGPGLTWDKGVPLSFISIGKWRWETSDATASVQFKLYKNDEIECTALGERSLDAGVEQALTATF